MRTEKRQKTVDYEVYIASDGKEFTYMSDVELYEAKLKGIKKNCPNCNGTGQVNERYETVTWDFGHSSKEMLKSDTCKNCNGKGILELKWV